jgi:hypothetical protein
VCVIIYSQVLSYGASTTLLHLQQQAASTHHVDAMDAALALCEQAHYVPPVSSTAATSNSSNISTTASTKQTGADAAADDAVAMHVDTADVDSTRRNTGTNNNATKTSAASTTVKLR